MLASRAVSIVSSVSTKRLERFDALASDVLKHCSETFHVLETTAFTCFDQCMGDIILIKAITMVSHIRSPWLVRTQAVQHLLCNVFCKECNVCDLGAKKLFEIADIVFRRSPFDDLTYLWR